MPAVSVIVPIYNVERYMEKCVRSLFGQTLEDIEFVFVDDCTPDQSVEILLDVLEAYPSRKTQVKIGRMPQNSGQAKVRMKGLSLATGDYIIHCDADDFVEERAYETMYRKAVTEGCDIVICDYRRGNATGWENSSTYSHPGNELKDILTGRVMGSLCCRLVKRTLMEDLIPPVGNMAEDMVICLQLTAKARSFGYVPIPLYSYLMRPDSISHEAGMKAAMTRQEAMYANSRLCVAFLQSHFGYTGLEPEMVWFKYRTRHYLKPFVHHKEVYEQWRDTFPEVDRQLFSTSGIPWEEKFWYVLIRLHLYHPWKVLSGRHKLN